METYALINALKELRERIDEEKDSLLEMLVDKFDVPFSVLHSYYDYILCVTSEQEANDSTNTKDKIWSQNEHLLLKKLLQDLEEGNSRNKIFELVSPIIGRTHGGISFYYYHRFKERESKEENNQHSDVKVSERTVEEELDLFEDLETIARNTEKLQGFQLEGLFRHLAHLSTLAVQTQNIERVEEIEQDLALKEATILAYEKKLDEKEVELSRVIQELNNLKTSNEHMRKIVSDFHSLNNSKKLSAFREFSEKIKEIVLGEETTKETTLV